MPSERLALSAARSARSRGRWTLLRKLSGAAGADDASVALFSDGRRFPADIRIAATPNF
jgi:hypothetical protein